MRFAAFLNLFGVSPPITVLFPDPAHEQRQDRLKRSTRGSFWSFVFCVLCFAFYPEQSVEGSWLEKNSYLSRISARTVHTIGITILSCRTDFESHEKRMFCPFIRCRQQNCDLRDSKFQMYCDSAVYARFD